MLFGKILARAFSLCGIRAVEFPAVRFPTQPIRPESTEPVWEYKLWGLTLGMTAELFAAGGQPFIALESNSCTCCDSVVHRVLRSGRRMLMRYCRADELVLRDENAKLQEDNERKHDSLHSLI